jgi:hypothetical protein
MRARSGARYIRRIPSLSSFCFSSSFMDVLPLPIHQRIPISARSSGHQMTANLAAGDAGQPCLGPASSPPLFFTRFTAFSLSSSLLLSYVSLDFLPQCVCCSPASPGRRKGKCGNLVKKMSFLVTFPLYIRSWQRGFLLPVTLIIISVISVYRDRPWPKGKQALLAGVRLADIVWEDLEGRSHREEEESGRR